VLERGDHPRALVVDDRDGNVDELVEEQGGVVTLTAKGSSRTIAPPGCTDD
jgi:hypothetical protein